MYKVRIAVADINEAGTDEKVQARLVFRDGCSTVWTMLGTFQRGTSPAFDIVLEQDLGTPTGIELMKNGPDNLCLTGIEVIAPGGAVARWIGDGSVREWLAHETSDRYDTYFGVRSLFDLSPADTTTTITRPVAQPVAQPIAPPAPQPVAQPAPQPIAPPAPQPVAQPAPQPVAQPTAPPAAPPAARPASRAAVVHAVLPVPDQQRVDGRSRFWAFKGDRYRLIEISDAPDRTTTVVTRDRPISTCPALDGLLALDTIWPVPDRQRIGPLDGGEGTEPTSEFWVFSGDRYRKIAIEDGPAHANRALGEDRPIRDWSALDGFSFLDAVLPVPGHQRVNGTSRYWVFCGDRYRLIEVEDGPAHANTIITPDRPVGQWAAFEGWTHVDAFLPVPDHQGVDDKSRYWAFSGDHYRIIEIDHGVGHADTLVSGDRPVSQWATLT
ncbi:PLAT/LH2 domain-containing protein [Streptomyces netropsis]|nr:PLAT/LH2 domain-containing protein [Streptomyces netropsis]